MTESATRQLTEALIAQRSVTPEDALCQQILAARLTAIGFAVEGHPHGDVKNFWAIKLGALADKGKVLVFAGHTDVVPPGKLTDWTSDPFEPTERNGLLYGRGAADMKTSLAAMVVAAEEFVAANVEHKGTLAFLITSDEEGAAIDGTVRVCDALKAREQRLDYCVVGEPTSVEKLGDMIKNGRRGTLSGKLIIKGVQGHIAYPTLAVNPIHLAVPALTELTQIQWDAGNQYYAPTSWQVSNIHSGTGVGNVIPGECVIDFNFRFCTENTPESLKSWLQEVLDKHKLTYDLQWTLGGLPFLTQPAELSRALSVAITAETGVSTELSTSGGTSDGRFIAQICPQVIEFGPVNASIHKVDEHVAIDTIDSLKNIYRRTMEQLIA
jgi:succinyl-diaminopimelate desuccinylase